MSFVFYARGHRAPDVDKRLYAPVLPDASTARAWLNFFLGAQPYERVGNRIFMRTDFDIMLDCNEMVSVFNAEPSALGDEAKRLIGRFKHGSWDEDHTEVIEQAAKAAQPVKQPRPDKPDGLTTITELCKQFNIVPLKARAALRSSGLTKPDYGWAFADADLPKIKKLIGVS